MGVAWPELRPDFVEQIHERVVDHESDGNVEADSRQSWHSSFVESKDQTN